MEIKQLVCNYHVVPITDKMKKKIAFKLDKFGKLRATLKCPDKHCKNIMYKYVKCDDVKEIKTMTCIGHVCKDPTKLQVVKTKNNRLRLKGVCGNCKSKLSRFISFDQIKSLVKTFDVKVNKNVNYNCNC